MIKEMLMAAQQNSGHNYQEFFPSALLTDVVKCFYYFQCASDKPERILPFGSTEITIKLNSNPELMVKNSTTKASFSLPSAMGEMIGICFHPWGFNHLFNIPASEISDEKIDLRCISPVIYDQLVSRIANKTNLSEIIWSLQDYLIGIQAKKLNGMVKDGIHFIDHHKGILDIKQFYKRYSISERRLQQLFMYHIGVPPKKYCQLKRFHYAISQLRTDTVLTNVALKSGYYDQAHFIHEFRAFAGINPKAFLEENNLLNTINATTYFNA